MTDVTELYGKYRLLERISASRVAEVFRAKSHGVEGFEKVVVIKRLSRASAKVPGYIEAFIEEAKAAVSLSHANLVQVFDLGQVDRSFYLAMEHVNGPDLGHILELLRVLRPHRLPTDLAIHLVCEVIKALDYTHRRKDYQLHPLNLVHGGVHPWNVLVSQDGEVKLTAFGARRLQELLPPPLRPPPQDWAPYLPPELQEGQPWAAASQSADAYSAGILLLELLAGHLPAHPGEIPGMVGGLVGLPAGLAEALLRTLQPDPGARFPRTGELYETLVALLFRAGLKPSNRALGVFVVDLLARPLPDGTVFAPRELPLAAPQPAPTAGFAALPPALSSTGGMAALSPPSSPGALPVLPPSYAPAEVAAGSYYPPASAARRPGPPPPPPSPRRAPVVQADPARAVPALPDARQTTPVERPTDAPPAAWAAGRSLGVLHSVSGHVPQPPPLPPEEGRRISHVETVRIPSEQAHEPADLDQTADESLGEGPGRLAAAALAAAAALPVLPAPQPPARSHVSPSRPELRTPAAELPRSPLLVPGLHGLPADPPSSVTLPLPRPPEEGSGQLASQDRSLILREAAVLHLRAAGYAGQAAAPEIPLAIERWGGTLLPRPDVDGVTALFFSSSLPARALMRALHAALQLADPADEQARFALGVHSGPVRLRGGEGSPLRGDPDDPVVRQATTLADSANPGEVLCSEIGPLLVASEFSFSPPLHLADGLVAHRAAHFLTVTTQRSSLVPESLRTQVTRTRIPGRDEETRRILSLIHEVRQEGRGRILALQGGPGVGKSTLVETVRRVVDTEDLSWFHVRLFGGFGEVPYWGLRALLGAICAVEEEHPALEVRARLDRLVQLGLNSEELSGVASIFALQRRGSSRSRFSPSLGQLVTSDSRTLLAGTLHKVIANLAAERPLVLVLEDLEHLDPETWGLLEELSRRGLESWPALLWLTSREPIPLPASPLLQAMTLGPPTDEAVRTRLRRVARLYQEEELSDERADLLRLQAGETPRHAEEFVRFLGESGQLPSWMPGDELPPTLAALVARRLALCSTEELELLRAASVIGQLFGVGLLTWVTRCERATVEETLQRAVRRGMVEAIGPGLYAFRHELFPAVLYGEADPQQVRALHERIACQLESAHAEDRARFLEELAHHFSRAGNAEKAVRYLEALADRMEAGHHYRAAISRMQVAATLLEGDRRGDPRRRIEVLQRLGRLAIAALDLELGRQALEQALALAQQTRQERRVAQTMFYLGQLWLAAGRFDEALTHLERALRLSEGLHDRALAAGIYGALGETYHKNGNLSRALDYLARGTALADREGDNALAGRLLLLQANCSAATGSFGTAERALERASQLAGRGAGDPVMQCAVHKTRSLVEFFRKDFAASLQACLDGLELAQGLGATAEAAVLLHNAGDCCRRQGDPGRALAFLERSQEICLAHGLSRTSLTNTILLTQLELERPGDEAEAERGLQALAEHAAAARRANLVWENIQANLLLGQALAARGRREQARGPLEAAVGEARRIQLQFAVEEAEAALAGLPAEPALQQSEPPPASQPPPNA